MFGIRYVFYLLLIAANTFGQIHGIEVTSDAQPNCWRLETMVEQATKGARTDRDKALALYRFGSSHLIHFNGPVEQNDLYVTDPTRLIGVYGYALCGNNSAAMNALYEAAGMKARVRWLKYHEIPEVWFDNRWNYLDSDMFGYVFLDDGKTIASVDDLVKDADLFLRQKNPPEPYFPFDQKADMASVFRSAYNRKNYHAYSNTHLMRLGLRTGESVRMFYRPQGRFYLREGLPHDLGTVYRDYWTLGAVRDGSLAWTDESPATYGNARFDYIPQLRSKVFLTQNPEVHDVEICEGEQSAVLCAVPGGTASMVIDVNTPWLIAGLQNDLANLDDNSDGARITGEFWRLDDEDRNVISVSTDNGNSWAEVWRNPLLGAIPFQVDLTSLVEGKSSYKVKFEWTDRARNGRAGIAALAIRTWTQLSPMALPRLVPGDNIFSVAATGESALMQESRWHRKRTLPGEMRENLAAAADAPYLRQKELARPGVLQFRLPEAPNTKELRISVLARALPGTNPRSVRVALSISEDDGQSWKELQRFAPHDDHEEERMWFNHALSRNSGISRRTLLRVEVDRGGLERVETSILKSERTPLEDVLRITHTWLEEESPKSVTRELRLINGAGKYEINVGDAGIRNRELLIEALEP